MNSFALWLHAIRFFRPIQNITHNDIFVAVHLRVLQLFSICYKLRDKKTLCCNRDRNVYKNISGFRVSPTIQCVYATSLPRNPFVARWVVCGYCIFICSWNRLEMQIPKTDRNIIFECNSRFRFLCNGTGDNLIYYNIYRVLEKIRRFGISIISLLGTFIEN